MSKGVVTCSTCLNEAAHGTRSPGDVFFRDVSGVSLTNYRKAREVVKSHLETEPLHHNFVLLLLIGGEKHIIELRVGKGTSPEGGRSHRHLERK